MSVCLADQVMAGGEEEMVISVSNDDSLYDQQSESELPSEGKVEYVEYVKPDWWDLPAKLPILVNLCSGAQCDININDNEDVASLSYWSLPFAKKEFRKHGNFNLRQMLREYKKYLIKDAERLSYLPALSGLRLGHQGEHSTHGHVLIQLFDELKITCGDVYMCHHYRGYMPSALRSDEMETIERYNARHRRWMRKPEVRKHRYGHSEMLCQRGRNRRHDSKTRSWYKPKGMENMTYEQYVDSYMRNHC